jgi:spermidine synthase
LVDEKKPKKILIIGAAGFTLPQMVAHRSYTEHIDVVDIDGSLEEIATTYFLEASLDPKIQFYKQSARHFLREKIIAGEVYDFIFIDAYNGRISIPSELLTAEFFRDIRKLSSDVITMNVIIDPLWESDFAGSLLATLSKSFSGVFLEGKNYDTPPVFDNFIVANQAFSGFTLASLPTSSDFYTDDQNTLEIDKYRLFYRSGYN